MLLQLRRKQPVTEGSKAVKPPISQSEETEVNHVLVIDDSNQICSLVVTGIVQNCYELGTNCRVMQSGPLGLIETVPMNFSSSVFDNRVVTVYAANSPRNALPILRMANIKRLTVICDIVMPNDVEVGLVGLLGELAEMQMPVNLLFASGEGQNRAFVEELIKRRKAYFVEKGSRAWSELPYALVEKSNFFEYRVLVHSDYDQGRLRQTDRLRANYAPPRSSSPTTKLKNDYTQERLQQANNHLRLASAQAVLAGTPEVIPPVRVEEVAALPPEPIKPRPPLKTSTGLLNLLTFWRKRSAAS